MDAKEPTTIETVWGACVDLLKMDSKPIPLWAVAQNCNWDETKLMAALINHTRGNGAVDFKFGPNYVAIIGLMDKNGNYGTLAR